MYGKSAEIELSGDVEDLDESFRFWKGRSAKKERVDDAEHRRVQSHTEGEGED